MNFNAETHYEKLMDIYKQVINENENI